MSIGELSVGELSVGELSVDEMSVGELSGYLSDTITHKIKPDCMSHARQNT